MAWIESHTSLARHPKTIRLAKLLELSMPAAIGHLHLLWWWALEYAEEGDLSEFDPQEIAEAGGFAGDGEAFVSALRRARFLDENGRLHDWDDYAGRLLARRHTEAERLRRWRADQREERPPSINKPNETRTKREYETRMSGVTVPNRTVPNRTEPNRTGDERARARARPGDETKETEKTEDDRSTWPDHGRQVYLGLIQEFQNEFRGRVRPARVQQVFEAAARERDLLLLPDRRQFLREALEREEASYATH